MGITRIGSNKPKYKVGNTDVKEIYLGSLLVYPEDEPTPTPTEKPYLKITASESGTINVTNRQGTFYYSTDSGSTWSTLTTGGISVNNGDEILWKAEITTPQEYQGIGTFTSTGKFTVNGNPMSLLYGDNFEDKTDLTGKDYAFARLFEESRVTRSRGIIIPKTLSKGCFYRMFSNCEYLSVPVSTLGSDTILAEECCREMYYSSTLSANLTKLPATTLAKECYRQMYSHTILTTPPELPATTLAEGCYQAMFEGCTSLTTAPVLSATTLTKNCYAWMFNGCTSLVESPELKASVPQNGCYQYMFQGCTSLNKITCLLDTPTYSYTEAWVSGVGSSGTFVKKQNIVWPTDYTHNPNDSVPIGWTVQDYN